MRTHRFGKAAAALAACLLAASCGGDEKTDTAARSTASTVAAPNGVDAAVEGAEDVADEGAGGAASPGAPTDARSSPGKSTAAKPGSTTNSTVAVANVGPRPATENRTGIAKDKIKLGYHWPKSGPFGPLLRTYHEHFRLYFEGKGGINDRGGIGGRKIELVETDDKGTPAGASAAAKEMEDAGVFTAYGHSGVEGQVAVLSHFEQKRIPYIANGLMSTHVKSSSMGFTFLTPWDILATTVPSFISNVVDAKGKKLGVMWETPDWPVPKDSFVAAAKDAGLNIVIVEEVGATQASYVSNVDKVRAAGATAVVLIGRLSAPGILRDARAIGYAPTWTGFGPWTLNLFNTVSGGLMEGIKAVRQWQGVDSAKYAEYVNFLKANGKGDDATEEGYGGWMIGFFYEQIVARAGADPTRESFIEGLEGTIRSPVNLVVTPPIRYSREKHWMSEESLPVQVKSGNWRKIGEFARRF